MERLTEKERAWQEDLYWCDYLNPSAQAIDDVYSRLADIEDILGSKYDIDRMRELIEADREGRCVVLPCKVGDSMWVHDEDGKPREMKLDSPDIRCYCKEEDNFCMTLCAEKRTGVCAYRLRNDGKDIGKTVFRTREAAEAALKAMKEGKNDVR